MNERPINQIIGENIQRYMEERGISKLAFKKETGLDGKRFRLLLKGEIGITTRKLQEIALVLDVKTLDLLEDWTEE